MSERPPILAHVLPLRGRQLIEASAGTGKTWTLAALYVRLVIGHGRGGLSQGLLPPQILVMTFTEAATAELRDRIRERLRQAAAAFALPLNTPPADDFLAALVQDTPDSERAACAEQLSRSVSWMDESAIHTIHGWSMRALREHAFQSLSLFELQHLPDAQQVWLELARDHVRQFIYPLSASALAALAAEKLTPDPDTWVVALKEKRQDFQRHPSRPIDPATLPSPQQALQAMSDWLDQEQAILNEIKNHFDPQLAQDILAYKKTTQGVLGHLKSNHIDALMARVMAWVKGHELTVKTEDLSKLGYQQMVTKKWPAEKAHQALKDIDRWLELQAHKPTSIREAVLDHALHSMLHAYRQLKEKAGLFDFQDLLEHLYWAVTDQHNNLAQVLREQHPVALVDEFQDTDPWQYGTLNRIYAPQTEGTLVMIGDPKQAIYSFRGADVQTYLQARTDCLALDAKSRHSLLQNRRSTPALLATLNGLFAHHPALFGTGIDFSPALPTEPQEGTPQAATPPVQVVVSEGWGDAQAQDHRDFLLSHMITDMVRQLDSGQTQPQDLAVLVRSHGQAEEVLKALARSRIPAVYLSDRSHVYQSDEARDLWLLLQALAEPRRTGALRAALGTPLWGLTDDELVTLTTSMEAWDGLLELALKWHQHWLNHGVFPMLRLWLLNTGAAKRLLGLADGERKLTNLLHLGELLQQATHAMTAQGIATQPHATVRHLGQEIRRSGLENSPAQTRLESDEARVKVVSFHKSKGLQYPHVYIPFLSACQAAPEKQKEDDEEEGPMDRSKDVDEDTRLLYVAMTRAERSLWLGVYPHGNEFLKDDKSALCRWFNRTAKTQPWANFWNDVSQKIPGLQATQPLPLHPPVWAAPAPAPLQGGPKDAPRLRLPHWWNASFSGLTRRLGDDSGAASWHASNEHEREVDTEKLRLAEDDWDVPKPQEPWQSFGAGARYGTLLHDLLQWQAERDWPLAQGLEGPEWRALMERQPLLTDAERALLSPWLRAITVTPLPLAGASDVVLGSLKQPAQWAEMPFHFGVTPLPVQRMDQLIRDDLFAGRDRPTLQPAVLSGMVNGFIDLVFHHDGRYWVLDYKSNRLDHYGTEALQNALLEKRYDVQSVLYMLALHRLLKVRLSDYDPARHLGGAAYLFIRGIGSAGAGVVMQQPSAQLIITLDVLMGADAGGVA